MLKFFGANGKLFKRCIVLLQTDSLTNYIQTLEISELNRHFKIWRHESELKKYKHVVDLRK